MLRINTQRQSEHWIESETGEYLACYLGDKVLLKRLVDLANADEARETARRGKQPAQPSLPLETAHFHGTPPVIILDERFDFLGIKTIDVTPDREDIYPFDPQESGVPNE